MEINGIEYVDIPTAATIIKVTGGRVRQLIANGQLSSIKVGKRLNLLPLREVETFAQKIRKNGRPKEVLDNV